MDLTAQPTPTDLIALVRDTAAAVRARETELLVLATVWADAHPDLEADAENRASLVREATGIEPDRDPEAPDPRVPAVAWDAGAPFAAALGVSTSSGEAMIRDALVLHTCCLECGIGCWPTRCRCGGPGGSPKPSPASRRMWS